MTYVMNGVLHNTGCEKSLLIFLTILLLSTIQNECAVLYPCVTSGNDLICDNLDSISQIPSFRPSNTTYDWLMITNTPALTTVQENAFSSLKVKGINLERLGVTIVDSAAFSGLGYALTQLHIKHTALESLPDDVFNPVNQSLINLQLHHNQLTTVTSALFSNLIYLKKLNLYANKLETIADAAFTNLINLRYIYLHKNKLKTVGSTLFSNLIHLDQLNLYANNLVTIADAAFTNLTNLRYIYLNRNKLNTVGSTLFSNLIHLKTLLLSINALDTIADDAFINLTELRTLHLYNNTLKTLSSNLFINLNQLTSLKIGTNPYICDCRLVWLRNSTLHTQGIIHSNQVCFSPPSLIGEPITSFLVPECDTTSDTTVQTTPTATTSTSTTTLPTTQTTTNDPTTVTRPTTPITTTTATTTTTSSTSTITTISTTTTTANSHAMGQGDGLGLCALFALVPVMVFFF